MTVPLSRDVAVEPPWQTVRALRGIAVRDSECKHHSLSFAKKVAAAFNMSRPCTRRLDLSRMSQNLVLLLRRQRTCNALTSVNHRLLHPVAQRRFRQPQILGDVGDATLTGLANPVRLRLDSGLKTLLFFSLIGDSRCIITPLLVSTKGDQLEVVAR